RYTLTRPGKGLSLFASKHFDAEWSAYWGRPEVLLDVGMYDFGSKDLGQAYFLRPGIRFTVYRSKSWTWQTGLRSGIAFLNKPFDPVENPNNNAIGSHWNNSSEIESGLTYFFDNHGISVFINLLHFSNGLAASPNTGLNSYNLSLAYKSKIGAKKQAPGRESRHGFGKWMAEAGYYLGLSQNGVYGGPTYAVH